MATITISRQFGAGGTTLGRRLAKRLGYRYVDDELIKEVAKNVGVSWAQVRTIEKGGTSKVMKLLEKIVSEDFIERQVSEKYGYIDTARYVEEVTAVIRKLHEGGNVVIIGRGGNYALKGYKDVYHILLVGDIENRINFLIDNYNMTRKQAESAVWRADMIRKRFLDCFSSEGLHNDPLLYDMILNINNITMDKAEDLLVNLVS